MSEIRTWEVPDLLFARGDRTQLAVTVSVTVKESDEVWAPIAEHIRDNRMHLMHERRVTGPGPLFREVYARWYGRKDLFAYVAAFGISDKADARIDATLESLR